MLSRLPSAGMGAKFVGLSGGGLQFLGKIHTHPPRLANRTGDWGDLLAINGSNY
ncbi:hypothetical protein [Chroococcidiopsis sp. CCMEE 29]|uniref:hypothetical protein n=1 Tax=Chroococcidiopsis sp. CCMEE 29 TaxID=155894 RepID=UPI00201FE96D|nr:hypothetical protein [Chroococcidiopsis sp. CCMEE 29]